MISDVVVFLGTAAGVVITTVGVGYLWTTKDRPDRLRSLCLIALGNILMTLNFILGEVMQ